MIRPKRGHVWSSVDRHSGANTSEPLVISVGRDAAACEQWCRMIREHIAYSRTAPKGRLGDAFAIEEEAGRSVKSEVSSVGSSCSTGAGSERDVAMSTNPSMVDYSVGASESSELKSRSWAMEETKLAGDRGAAVLRRLIGAFGGFGTGALRGGA